MPRFLGHEWRDGEGMCSRCGRLLDDALRAGDCNGCMDKGPTFAELKGE